MGFIPAGVFFTVIIAAVYCHAVNLIDGMNGLAANVVIFSSVGVAVLAAHGGLGQITVLALLLAATSLGFQLLNWPVARLFLGDAGAYGLGHVLVWLGISVIALAPDVAVPAVTHADNAKDKSWPDRFATDRSAWDFFLDQVERLGDDAILGPPRRDRDEDWLYRQSLTTRD